MSNDSVESFVQMKYFSPFDLNNIPYHVLTQVYAEALGEDALKLMLDANHKGKYIRYLLSMMVNEIELQNGIKRILVKELA